MNEDYENMGRKASLFVQSLISALLAAEIVALALRQCSTEDARVGLACQHCLSSETEHSLDVVSDLTTRTYLLSMSHRAIFAELARRIFINWLPTTFYGTYVIESWRI